MREPTREPTVTRYDFEHPVCDSYYCCGGGYMEPYVTGDYVRYDDYDAIVAERDALTARLAACEKIVEATVTFVSAEEKAGDDMTAYTQSMAQLADAVRLRAAVAAETCARSAPITVGDTQGET
jgi:hypothetical protein